MKRDIYILLISIISLTCTSFGQQSGWVWQNPLPQGNDLLSIKMFSSGTGYCRSNYSILKTTNQGNNWQIVVSWNEIVMDIFCVDEQTIYMLSGDYSYVSKLYKSINGGINWQFVFSFVEITPSRSYWLNDMTGFANQMGDFSYGTKIHKTTNGGISWFGVFNDATIDINDMSFASTTTGYIAGRTLNPSIFAAKFLKTTSGGNNWDSITIRGIREISSVCFINDQSGFISGNRSHLNGPSVLRTTTGGSTWDSVFYPSTNFYFKKLEFVNFNTGYGGYSQSNLYKTTNAGVNWVNLNTFNNAGFNHFDFSISNAQSILICGEKGKLSVSTNEGSNWLIKSEGFYFGLYGIKFFDANTGIAVGGNSVRGVVLRTTNSGLQWDTTTIDTSDLEAVYKYDENTAFLSSLGAVFKTTNRGLSFTKYQTFSRTYWDDICFPDENTGYVVSKYRIVDKTTDGGNTWVNVLPFHSQDYFTICFVNSNTGFIGGGRILKTTNGGTSWDTVFTGILPYYHTNKIAYLNGVLYSVGNKSSNNYYIGVIAKSTDLGQSWSADSIQNVFEFYDITIPSPNVRYVLGTSSIYKSINNSPWVAYNIFTSSGWKSSITFLNNDTGFVSTYYGGILKTTNGGGTPIGILPGQNEIPASFSLSQNYPNPFNPVTIISYSLPKNTQVRIIVYDILGRLVKQLVNENQNPGKYSVSFDGTDFASGVYFYTIETPDFTQSKKMVLLK